MSKLPPLSQDYLDDNRKRFEADWSALDVKSLNENKCKHYFERKSFSQVQCKLCRVLYIDNGRFKLHNGALVGVK